MFVEQPLALPWSAKKWETSYFLPSLAQVMLQYDKLYVDGKCYAWNDVQGRVTENTVGCLQLILLLRRLLQTAFILELYFGPIVTDSHNEPDRSQSHPVVSIDPNRSRPLHLHLYLHIHLFPRQAETETSGNDQYDRSASRSTQN